MYDKVERRLRTTRVRDGNGGETVVVISQVNEEVGREKRSKSTKSTYLSATTFGLQELMMASRSWESGLLSYFWQREVSGVLQTEKHSLISTPLETLDPLSLHVRCTGQ